jgi:hypothetical protein
MALDFPTNPSVGDIFDGIWQWDGTKWVPAPGSGVVIPPPAIIDNVPPPNPETGDLWWDDVGGQLYVYYNDGTTTQWVQANVSPVGPAGAPGPAGATGPTGPAGPNTLPMGVTDGSNAAAGQIGEFLYAETSGTLSITSGGTNVTIVDLAISAGDWDVSGLAAFLPGPGMINLCNAYYFLNGNQYNPGPSTQRFISMGLAASPGPTSVGVVRLAMPVTRLSLSAAGTVSIWGGATATGSSSFLAAYASIQARRMR